MTTNLRRVARGALLAAVLGAVTASSAQAGPGPDPDPRPRTYPVKTNLDGRYFPKKGWVYVEDFLERGQRVRIQCQTYGDSAYGSKLWDLVPYGGERYYVPDAFVQTGHDGRAPGIRACDSLDEAKSGYDTDPFKD
jgi:hypothetical protein